MNGDQDKNKQLAEKTNRFIFWYLNEFKENTRTNLYSFTKESIYDPNSTRFLENLSSFVGNCIYDDFSFVIEYHDYPDEYYEINNVRERINKFGFKKPCIRKINGIFNYDDKTMRNWEPILLSVGDENPNFTQNPDYILSAIKFMEDKEKYWRERANKFEQKIKQLREK
jgi:hypothetical protein